MDGARYAPGISNSSTLFPRGVGSEQGFDSRRVVYESKHTYVPQDQGASLGPGPARCSCAVSPGVAQVAANVADEIRSDLSFHEAPLAVAVLEAIAVSTTNDGLQAQVR